MCRLMFWQIYILVSRKFDSDNKNKTLNFLNLKPNLTYVCKRQQTQKSFHLPVAGELLLLSVLLLLLLKEKVEQ